MVTAPPGMDLLNNAYLQAGAVGLLIAVLLFFIYATFRWVVRPLWEENKAARLAQVQMTERVVVIGEAGRAAGEKSVQALSEISKEIVEIGLKTDSTAREITKCLETQFRIEGLLSRSWK